MQTIPSLKYEILPLQSIQVRASEKSGSHSTVSDLTSRCSIRLGPDGKWMESSQRFWSSLFSLFGISASIFRYFSHQEVLSRVCQRRGSTDLRVCTEPGGRVLAVSSPSREPIGFRALRGLIQKYGPRDVHYDAGVASLTMVPKSGSVETKIGPDAFRNEYVVDVPLDGYGGPSSYLSLLRKICENGAVARVPEFRSDIVIGKDDPMHALSRALDTFDADEGYSALRKRLLAAQGSMASVRECLSLHQVLKAAGSAAESAYSAAVGDLCGLYGMTNLNSLGEKKQRVLPAKCTVYDLINVASQTTTHVVQGVKAMRIEAWFGSLVREEYDLEGVAPRGKDFEALFGKGHGKA